MVTSPSQSPRQVLLDQLAIKRRGLLILNYDTIVASLRDGEQVSEPLPQIRAVLHDIRTKTQTRVTIISDRRSEEVRKLLRLQPVPEIWGCYGLQRLHEDGRQEFFPISERAHEALCRAAALLQEEGLEEKTELRHGSLSIRWASLRPGMLNDVRVRSRRVLEAVASGGSVILSRTIDGIELRAPRAGKADAVSRMLEEFQCRGCVTYVGSDITDEEAFRTVKPHGLGILVRSACRQSSADIWLRSPDELATFLSEWLHAARGRT
jgi:trehalose 6-phosphate phosphatase